MGQFLDALKAGARGFKEGMEPGEFIVAGRPVSCPHCAGTRFLPRRVLLNTRAASFFNFDWTDSGATALVCAECGRIEWYARAPEEVVD